LNGFSDTIGALIGNGTVDVTGGGTSTLTVGDNDDSGTFSGVIQNTSGTLGLTKSGLGTETLGGSNTYTGPTVIDFGTLKVVNPNALGSGASALTINAGGSLDMSTNLVVASLNGGGGRVVNSSATANTLVLQNSAGNSTYGGVISGRIGILVNAGNLRLNAANAYSNATILAEGASLGFGSAGQVGPAGVIASNNTALAMPAGNPSATVAANITTVSNATAVFTSANTASTWNGQFIGSSASTNIFSGGNMSIGGAYSFSNFLGTVIITNGGVRWYNAINGGDNTTWIFTNGGGCFTRDGTIVRLGALFGNGPITGPSVGAPTATYWIGAKGLDSTFSGAISGSNNIVKVGVGRLTFNGVNDTLVPYSNNNQTYTTNIVDNGDGSFTTNLIDNLDQTYSTNNFYASAISYIGNTIVSNGVLALVAPNTFTNPASVPASITLATSTAVLDASQMGYVSNLLSVDDGITPTNTVVVTDGVLRLSANYTLAGRGTVKGGGVISSGTINPGSAGSGGTLSISNGLAINDGATNFFDLSDDLTGLVKPSDMINVQGNVHLSGNIAVTVGALNGVLTVGKYPVIKYSGNLINEGGVVPSGPISNFTLGGTFINTSRATLILSNAPGEVDLVVVSLNNLNLTWAGDGASNWWDVANSYTWTNGTDASPIQFYQLDSVTFGDTSNPTNDSVFLSGTLVPSFITTVNSTTNFIFGGNGSIGGSTMLMKKGSGTLILTNGANSYSGGTVISNGVLNAGSDSGNNQNDLALGTGPVTVNSTAELRFGGNSGGTVVRHYIVNPVTVNGGIVRASDGEQHLTNSTVTITATGGTLQTGWATKNLVLDSPLIGTGNVTVSAANGTNAAGGQVILNNPSNTISGSVIIVTNANLALVGLAGLSNSPSIDVQRGGTLDVSLRSNASLTLLSGQTLMGNGIIRGRFMTAASGSFLTPGASSIGTLTVTNTGNTTNFSTVTLGGTTIMEINRAASPNSDRLAASTNIFGGTLTVNNIGAALVAGDTFTLFTSVTNTGAFATTTLPTLPSGLDWSNSLASNGRLTVIAIAVVNLTPTNIVTSLTNGILTLSWPSDHTGWRLQTQTNSLAVGIGTNWFDVVGATTTNQVNVTMNLTNGTVFFRLIYP
jgi:autotransporter-associated beta strand protein